MMKFTSNFLLAILTCVAYEANTKAYIKTAAFEVNDRLKKLIQSEDDDDANTDEEDKNPTSSTEPHPHKTTPTQPSTSQAMMSKLTPQMSPKHVIDKPPQLQPSDSNTTQSESPLLEGSSPNEPSTEVISPEKESSPPPAIKEVELAAPKFHLLPVLAVLIHKMKSVHHETRIETLRWIMWLQQKIPKRIYLQVGKLFPALLSMLNDQYDKVLRMALQVLSILSSSKNGMEINGKQNTSSLIESPLKKPVDSKGRGTTDSKAKTTSDSKSRSPSEMRGKPLSPVKTKATEPKTKPHLNKYFRLFLIELLKTFGNDRSLLENKGTFIIRQLCIYVDAYSVYCTLADILLGEDDLIFASLMIQYLNLILFTSAELYDLRMQLKDLSTPDNWTLFTTLYRSWSHNPVATVALCLLTQNYDHASNLVQKFTNIDITSGLLKEIDRLVQLIESPIFSPLRLQLLAPYDHASLVRTLYGLLMLLPQSAAFNLLKNRLSCVPVITEVEQEAKIRRRKANRSVPSSVSFDDLLEHFVTVQTKHSVLAKKKASAQRQNS